MTKRNLRTICEDTGNDIKEWVERDDRSPQDIAERIESQSEYSLLYITALYHLCCIELRPTKAALFEDTMRVLSENAIRRVEPTLCDGTIVVATIDHGAFAKPEDVHVVCGSWRGGRRVYCEPCTDRLHLEYPQGWTAYPGDTCGHGVYVGGCGVDHMCHACEMGD
jgi:hypothetical protein